MFFPASVQRCTGAFELRAIEVSGDWPARVPDDVGASVGDMLADLAPLPGGGEHGARDLEGAVGRAGPVRARRVEPGRDPRMVDGIEPHPAAYPVPSEARDLGRPRAGEQQEPDRGGGEVVVGMVEHEAEALQLVQREEPLARGRPVAPHVAAGVRALGTKVPQFRLPHHDGEHGERRLALPGVPLMVSNQRRTSARSISAARILPKKGMRWRSIRWRLPSRVDGFQRRPWRRMNSCTKSANSGRPGARPSWLRSPREPSLSPRRRSSRPSCRGSSWARRPATRP